MDLLLLCNYFWPIKVFVTQPFLFKSLLTLSYKSPFVCCSAPFLVHLNRKSCLCFTEGKKMIYWKGGNSATHWNTSYVCLQLGKHLGEIFVHTNSRCEILKTKLILERENGEWLLAGLSLRFGWEEWMAMSFAKDLRLKEEPRQWVAVETIQPGKLKIRHNQSHSISGKV